MDLAPYKFPCKTYLQTSKSRGTHFQFSLYYMDEKKKEHDPCNPQINWSFGSISSPHDNHSTPNNYIPVYHKNYIHAKFKHPTYPSTMLGQLRPKSAQLLMGWAVNGI